MSAIAVGDRVCWMASPVTGRHYGWVERIITWQNFPTMAEVITERGTRPLVNLECLELA